MNRVGLSFALLLTVSSAALAADKAKVSPEVRQGCITCHEKRDPGILGQWKASKHGEMDVSCIDCHEAQPKEVDAFKHNGATIAVLVTPKDCAGCHPTEVQQQKGSHHAKAGQILGSLDNLLGEVIGGQPAVDAGCRQCHGSQVKVDKNGRPTADTWPNTGMGRINPDGSWGSCSACHTRHNFSVMQARQPEACGKCHLGPDHPQMEVWEESKHGILYRAFREQMKLDSDEWRAGIEYFTGPTCASCHMSATGKMPVTHDVGERIAWTLRPPISVRLNMVVFEDDSKEDITGDKPTLPAVGSMFTTKGGEQKKVKAVFDWKARRQNMREVCRSCHEERFIDGAYQQFEAVVTLYNDKFAKPCKAIVDELRATGKLTAADFDEELEWTWWEIWHHEGRRARHGAAMFGPDYTWWHGMYEVGKHFYTKFIPEMEKLVGKEEARKLLDKHVYSHPGHHWHRDGMNKEALDKVRKFYDARYKQ